MIFFFDLLFSLYLCWILTPGSLKSVQYWPSLLFWVFSIVSIYTRLFRFYNRTNLVNSRKKHIMWKNFYLLQYTVCNTFLIFWFFIVIFNITCGRYAFYAANVSKILGLYYRVVLFFSEYIIYNPTSGGWYRKYSIMDPIWKKGWAQNRAKNLNCHLCADFFSSATTS